MKINRKALELIEKGLSSGTVYKLSESQINDLLSVYNSEDDKYHIELVKSIMQIVEDFVIFDSKTGPMKKDIVMNICLKFFDDNHKLLNAVIEDQLKNIIHS